MQILSQFNSFSAQTQSQGEAAQTETSVQLSARGHYTAFHAGKRWGLEMGWGICSMLLHNSREP